MIYVDTSAIVKLYFRETHSRKIASWLKKTDEAIPLTSLHELEFENAICLKRFRGELNEQDARQVVSKFSEHEARGVYFRPAVDWSAVFPLAKTLSNRYAPEIGARALDILHVALALSAGADRFITLDRRQSSLAVAAGLDVRL